MDSILLAQARERALETVRRTERERLISALPCGGIGFEHLMCWQPCNLDLCIACHNCIKWAYPDEDNPCHEEVY